VSGLPPLSSIGPGIQRSILVPPPIEGDPEAIRRVAWQLESAAVDLDGVVVRLRNTVLQLTAGGGWTGPSARVFELNR
jgi:hypothetical protein